jgi:hypothetical protein
LEILARAISQEAEIKRIQIEKKIDKQSLCSDYMILYFKDLKNSMKKLLDTINSFSNVKGYEINLHK